MTPADDYAESGLILVDKPEDWTSHDAEAAAVLIYRVSEEIIHRIRIIGSDVESGRLLAELEDMVCRYLLASDSYR